MEHRTAQDSTETREKASEYARLVACRKTCSCCSELTNPSQVEDGRFDCDEIGPYSRWQGNLNAEFLVVGKDFADGATFRKYCGRPGDDVETNKRLVNFLMEAGIQIELPNSDSSRDRLFFTNAVLCLKRGNRSASLARSCLRQCGHRFLRRTVELIEPKIVATLGGDALYAMREAFSLPQRLELRERVAQPVTISDKTKLVPLYHPACRERNRTREMQRADWRRVGELLRAA